jgi:hypothetical protein
MRRVHRLSLYFVSVLTCLFSDYVPLVNLGGIYFQMRDDFMNLQIPVVYRPICLTMVENILTITNPSVRQTVVHGIHTVKSNRQILSNNICFIELAKVLTN